MSIKDNAPLTLGSPVVPEKNEEKLFGFFILSSLLFRFFFYNQ